MPMIAISLVLWVMSLFPRVLGTGLPSECLGCGLAFQ